jgi:hypothetical protein
MSHEPITKPVSMQAQLCCAILRINNGALNEHLVQWAFSDPTTLQQLFFALRYICDHGTPTHLQNNIDSVFRLASKGALLLQQNDGDLLFGGPWLLLESQASRFAYVTQQHSHLRAGSIYLLGALCCEVISVFVRCRAVFENLWSELTKFYNFGGLTSWIQRCHRIVYCVLDSAIRSQSANLEVSSTDARYALTLLGGALQYLLCPTLTTNPPFDVIVQRALVTQCASDIACVDQMLIEMAQGAKVPKLLLSRTPLCTPISVFIRNEWPQIRSMLDAMHLAPGITLSSMEEFLTPLPNEKRRAFRTRSMSSPKHGFNQEELQTLRAANQREQIPLVRREGVYRRLSQVAGIENQVLEARLHELLVLVQGAQSSICTVNELSGDIASFALVELANSLRLVVDVQESVLRSLLIGPVNALEEFVVNCTVFKMHRDTILRHKDAIISMSGAFDTSKGDKSILELILLPFTSVLSCVLELCERMPYLRSVHDKLVSLYCSLELFTHLRLFILEAQFEPAPGIVIPGALLHLFEDGIFVVTIDSMCVSLTFAVLVVVNETIVCGEYRDAQSDSHGVPGYIFQYPARPFYNLCFKATIDKETRLQDVVNSYGTL